METAIALLVSALTARAVIRSVQGPRAQIEADDEPLLLPDRDTEVVPSIFWDLLPAGAPEMIFEGRLLRSEPEEQAPTRMSARAAGRLLLSILASGMVLGLIVVAVARAVGVLLRRFAG